MSTVSSYLNPLKLFNATHPRPTLDNRDKTETQQSVASRGWKVGLVCTIAVGALALHRFSNMQGLLPARLTDSGFLQDYLSLRNQTVALTTLTLVSAGYTLLFAAAARKERPNVASLGYCQEMMFNEFVGLFEKDHDSDPNLALAVIRLTFKINAGTTSEQAYVRFHAGGSYTTPGEESTKVVYPTLRFTKAAQMTDEMINEWGLCLLAQNKGFDLTWIPPKAELDPID